jgi:hypothetical protein
VSFEDFFGLHRLLGESRGAEQQREQRDHVAEQEDEEMS